MSSPSQFDYQEKKEYFHYIIAANKCGLGIGKPKLSVAFQSCNFSTATFFHDENVFTKAITTLYDRYRKEQVNTFNSLITSRVKYLDELRNLKKGWISGSSKTPTVGAIEISKVLLASFNNWISMTEGVKIPKGSNGTNANWRYLY